MGKIIKYDDAKWHFESTAANLPDEERWRRAATHIGLMARWCAEHGSACGVDDTEDAMIAEVAAGRRTGTDWLGDFSSYKFVSEQIKDTARSFIDAYYGDNGLYLADIDKFLGDKIFTVVEEDVSYVEFRQMVDKRQIDFERHGSSAVTNSNA